VKGEYVPERGDIVWLDFDPQTGHEQRGKRPALVLSLGEYNKKIGLGVFCPITNQEKGYPFEVKIHHEEVTGVVLSDQVKSQDWTQREIKFIAKATEEEIKAVIEKISHLLGIG